jgi:hypothetical protein
VNKEAWDVFNEHPSRSQFPHQAGELKPKAAARALDTGAFSGLAEVLAWESSADEIDGFEFRAAKFADIAIALYLWPVLGQYLQAVRIVFDLPAALHAGALQAQIDSADSREQGSESHANCS